MHILIFEQRYTGLKEAGIGRFALLAREWIKEGHTVTVIAGMVNYISGVKPDPCKGRLFYREEEVPSVTIIRVFDSGFAYRTFLGRLISYATFLISSFVAGLLVQKPNVVIASSPPIFVGPIGWLTAVLRRAKFIFEVRDIWPDEAVELGFLKSKLLIAASRGLEKWLYRRAKKIIVNSPGLTQFLTEKKYVPKRKIAVIPNPVSLKELTPDQKTKKELMVLYAGSMSAVYDFHLLIEAAARLQNIKFVLVGDGREKPKAEKEAKERGLKNVIFLPPVPKDEVPAVISNADICVATLKNDVGLLRYVYATKAFDYMAGAKPVVLAMTGVTADLVCKEAHAGLCVAPGDADEFVGALRRLYENVKERETMGKRGREYLETHFDPAGLAQQYLDALYAGSL